MLIRALQYETGPESGQPAEMFKPRESAAFLAESLSQPAEIADWRRFLRAVLARTRLRAVYRKSCISNRLRSIRKICTTAHLSWHAGC